MTRTFIARTRAGGSRRWEARPVSGGAPGGLDQVVDHRELDEVRGYARRGGSSWPIHSRCLYAADAVFTDGNEQFETLHEFDLLYTDRNELFFVLTIFGEEYVINLGGRSVQGYEVWLQRNDRRSPLYSGHNAAPETLVERR
jgi:hypothetical protein